MALLGLLIGFMLPSIVATPAQAGILFYSNQAAWQAATSAISSEDFSSFGVDTSFRTSAVALNGMSIAQEGFDQVFRNIIEVPLLDFSPNSGSKSASLYTNFPQGTNVGTFVRVTFGGGNLAFGMNSWLGAGGEGATYEVYNGASLIGSTSMTGGAGDFLGYVLTGLDVASSVRFASSTLANGPLGQGIYLDNLVIATPVPEPASILLLVMGGITVAGCGIVRAKGAKRSSR